MKKLCFLLVAGLLTLTAHAQWVLRSASPNSGITDLNVLNPDTIFASSSGSMGVLKSVDGGFTWDTLTFGSITALKVHFPDQQHGFVAGFASFATGPSCFKTSDCGLTWQPMSDTIGPGAQFYKVHFVNKDTGFISNMGVLSRTTDGGATFTRQELATEYNYITNIHFIDRQTGFVSLVQYGDASNLDRIFKTTDCGLTWTEVYNESSGPQVVFVYEGISQMHFTNELNGWAITTGSPGKILKTTNGGNSWTELTGHSFTGYGMTDIYFLNQQEGYIVYEQSIYKTINGGQSWTKQMTSPPDLLVLEIEMLNNQLGYASGHGLFRTTNGGSPTSLPARTAASGGFRFYPNPSKGLLYIQNEQQKAMQHVALYDLSGRECKRYEGTVPDVLSLEGMANGVYIIMIQTREGAYADKIQLTR